MSSLDRLEALEKKVAELDRRTTFDSHDLANAVIAGLAAHRPAVYRPAEGDET